MTNDVLGALAVVLVVGFPVFGIWLIYYLNKLGLKNLQQFASEHGLSLTQKKPAIDGDISGRHFQYVTGFAKRKEMLYEFWRVDLKRTPPQSLAVIPTAFDWYLFPKGSLAKEAQDEASSRPEGVRLLTGDEMFDSSASVVCDDHDAARNYLTPLRRQALYDIGKRNGFLYEGELIVEKEQSRIAVKVLNKQLAGLLQAAEALDAEA